MDWRSLTQRGRATVRQNNTTKILVVDQDESSLAEIQASLETRQITAFCALNPQQALDVAAEHSLDLVICDFQARTETGIHLRTLIQSVPRNTNFPFLFTSASQKSDVISRKLGDRNVFFIRKPCERESLLTLVEFAMWTPQLIRTHIRSTHMRQGLNPPHATSQPARFPAGSTSAFASTMPSIL